MPFLFFLQKPAEVTQLFGGYTRYVGRIHPPYATNGIHQAGSTRSVFPCSYKLLVSASIGYIYNVFFHTKTDRLHSPSQIIDYKVIDYIQNKLGLGKVYQFAIGISSIVSHTYSKCTCIYHIRTKELQCHKIVKVQYLRRKQQQQSVVFKYSNNS